MHAVVPVYENPRKYKAGSDEYVEVAAQRARHAPNLVECFIAAMVAKGKVIRHIPEWLNERLGLDISYERLREWANGRRPLPDAVAPHMAEVAVPWILNEIGFKSGELPDEVLRALVMRAYPWAASINLPGRSPTRLDAETERWLARALMPPFPNETPPRKRKAKKAAKRGAKKTAKKVAKKSVKKSRR
jgi:hypothetical protein